jgi:alpha-tubulin suppressor-like RCC1 family protein
MAYKTTSKQSVANTGVTASSNITTTPPPVISQVYYTDSAYNVITATAAGTTIGGYLKLVGIGFQYGATVYVNGLATTVLSTTVVSSTEIRIRIAALTAATYSLMLFNPNNTGAIYANGIVYSAEPAWTTTSYSNTFETNTVNIQLLATGDVPLSYSLQAGSSLPAGVTLSSTGLLSGAAGNIISTTTVTFTVVVSDLQNQTTPQLISLSLTFNAGYLWAWGTEGVSQNYLGDGGGSIDKSSPVQVGATNDWLVLSPYGTGCMAIKKGGTLWGWGNAATGALGLGDATDVKNGPVQVGLLTNWSTLSTSGSHSLAIKTDGTLWAWGSNVGGRFGDGTVISKSSPVQVGSLTTWKSVAIMDGNGSSSAAIQTDGTLWTWGIDGGDGHLGLGDTISRSSPTQVGLLTNWSIAAMSVNAMAAIKTDGTLWVWGENSATNGGQLGLNDAISRSSPTQVGALTNWRYISITNSSVMAAIKTDGTLWTWGVAGADGTLGLGDIIKRSSPVQVGALTTWRHVSVGGGSGPHALAIKTDGTLWSWGRNALGQLGLGDTQARSSPVQVGTKATWKLAKVSGGSYTISI